MRFQFPVAAQFQTHDDSTSNSVLLHPKLDLVPNLTPEWSNNPLKFQCNATHRRLAIKKALGTRFEHDCLSILYRDTNDKTRGYKFIPFNEATEEYLNFYDKKGYYNKLDDTKAQIAMGKQPFRIVEFLTQNPPSKVIQSSNSNNQIIKIDSISDLITA
ncbi:hypothetical protein Glove_91g47 [Diversispora epigaea]|uniref:Uncharacterized protein n=1 Tax=Diversispora epigaea TaxID=1348612 RepID=A0A397J5K3_9GLOM|nr:hypothetical protein Glove_91g47 [Diversispora epigaea]